MYFFCSYVLWTTTAAKKQQQENVKSQYKPESCIFFSILLFQ